MMTPAASLAKSNAAAATLPRFEAFKKSLTSTTPAEATAMITRKGIKNMVGEVNGFRNDAIKSVSGTGKNVATAISDLDQMIVLALTGNVLEYSKPDPSEFNKPKGMSSEKIPPIEVATRKLEALNTVEFNMGTSTMIVSKTGNANKNAVAKFLEEDLRSFMI